MELLKDAVRFLHQELEEVPNDAPFLLPGPLSVEVHAMCAKIRMAASAWMHSPLSCDYAHDFVFSIVDSLQNEAMFLELKEQKQAWFQQAEVLNVNEAENTADTVVMVYTEEEVPQDEAST